MYLLKYLEGVYKIGVTNNIAIRLSALKYAYQGDIEVILCVPRVDPQGDEKYLLNKYKQCPTLGRSYFAGSTELRALTEQEVAEICLFLDQS